MNARWLLVVPLLSSVACATKRGPEATTTGTDAAPVSSAAPAPPPRPSPSAVPTAAFSDGAHDYRGTLGQKTRIAAHLLRSGPKVTGFYVYEGVGTSIPLVGTVEGAAQLTLHEAVDGKTTGTLQLDATGTELQGTWTSAKGDKTFPVHLAFGPAWRTTRADAGAHPARLAEACLADPSCPAAEADRLFIAADDARDANELDCFRFLDGSGTHRDAARGRSCLERAVATSSCGGSSPGLEQTTLAMLAIDGVGGPVDVAHARALLHGCFEDSTTSEVLAHADAKEANPKTPAVDFCKDLGGTTLVSNECAAQHKRREETLAALAAKTVVAGLDDANRALFVEASKAYAAYVDAMGRYAYEISVGGSIRNAMLLAREEELQRTRAKDLAAFARFVAGTAAPSGVKQAEDAHAKALAAVHPETPEERTAFAETEKTWLAYRDAEVKFYVGAKGPKPGEGRVEPAIRIRLENRRAAECALR